MLGTDGIHLNSALTHKPHLARGDLLIVDNEAITGSRGQFLGLHPEAHMAFLKDLIVQGCLQGHNCKSQENIMNSSDGKKKTVYF